MWLMTNFGFFSIVKKEGEVNLTVRARVKQDLLNLEGALSAVHRGDRRERLHRLPVPRARPAGGLRGGPEGDGPGHRLPEFQELRGEKAGAGSSTGI